jgi:ElaB/YqjD/DUF883 family membrane-anchored ribosome-binding protein
MNLNKILTHLNDLAKSKAEAERKAKKEQKEKAIKELRSTISEQIKVLPNDWEVTADSLLKYYKEAVSCTEHCTSLTRDDSKEAYKFRGDTAKMWDVLNAIFERSPELSQLIKNLIQVERT